MIQGLAFVFAFILSLPTLALTNSAKALNIYETEGNGAGVRYSGKLKLSHYEIPLHLLEVSIADLRIDPEVLSSLVFEKNGSTFVRWILNPEDTVFFQQIERYFRDRKGYNLEKKTYFDGYRTASRTYIVEDPETHVQFAVKTSTNKTGGEWQNKRLTPDEAIDAKTMADFLFEQNSRQEFKHFIVMDEPAVFIIPDIHQGMVIRSLGELNNPEGKRIYLPGFSALHDKVGREIAEKNGSKDPYEFWNEHFIKAVGRALGELAARTGLVYESKHAQNFLIELDENLKPTGRIVLRDLSDLEINFHFVKALFGDDPEILRKIRQKEQISKMMEIGFAPLKGNRDPKWLKEGSLWSETFLRAVLQSFTEEVNGSLSTDDVKLIGMGLQHDEFIVRFGDIESAKWMKTHAGKLQRFYKKPLVCPAAFQISY